MRDWWDGGCAGRDMGVLGVAGVGAATRWNPGADSNAFVERGGSG